MFIYNEARAFIFPSTPGDNPPNTTATTTSTATATASGDAEGVAETPIDTDVLPSPLKRDTTTTSLPSTSIPPSSPQPTPQSVSLLQYTHNLPSTSPLPIPTTSLPLASPLSHLPRLNHDDDDILPLHLSPAPTPPPSPPHSPHNQQPKPTAAALSAAAISLDDVLSPASRSVSVAPEAPSPTALRSLIVSQCRATCSRIIAKRRQCVRRRHVEAQLTRVAARPNGT